MNRFPSVLILVNSEVTIAPGAAPRRTAGISPARPTRPFFYRLSSSSSPIVGPIPDQIDENARFSRVFVCLPAPAGCRGPGEHQARGRRAPTLKRRRRFPLSELKPSLAPSSKASGAPCPPHPLRGRVGRPSPLSSYRRRQGGSLGGLEDGTGLRPSLDDRKKKPGGRPSRGKWRETAC